MAKMVKTLPLDRHNPITLTMTAWKPNHGVGEGRQLGVPHSAARWLNWPLTYLSPEQLWLML